jgi:ATP-dependent RNA circularization protein (DNA/RNA ligase family)
MTNYSNLTNQQLYIKYQQAKTNFRNAEIGSPEELEADRIFTELSKEVANRDNFNWLEYKLAEQEQNILTKDLLQGLINYIEALEDGGVINLVNFIECDGIEVTDELLMYLYNNTKHLNITTKETINNIPQSIKVFAR